MSDGGLLHYRLAADGQTPIKCASFEEWVAWRTSGYEATHRVARTAIGADVEVSTVFLGLDHNWGAAGPPILWETMIFGGPHNQEQWRYSSHAAAVAGHAAACELAAETAAAGPTYYAKCDECVTARWCARFNLCLAGADPDDHPEIHLAHPPGEVPAARRHRRALNLEGE